MKKLKKVRPKAIDRYEASLVALTKLLRKPRTAAEVATALGCSKQSAYSKIATLERRGLKLKFTFAEATKTGPRATVFQIGGAV